MANNHIDKFASLHALSIYSRDAIYSFIPKNACSTMRYTIGVENGMISGPDEYSWIHPNNETFAATLSELVKAKYAFVILRDPYRRIGSCFLDKVVDQTPVSWTYYLSTYKQTPPALLTFRTFITGLAATLGTNEHWRPQVDFLVYKDYDDIFCVEDFDCVEKTLYEKLGLVIHDGRQLTRHGADQFEPLDTNESFADAPVCDIAALKRACKIPRIEQLYDPSIAADVGQLFAEDIAVYTQTTGRTCMF